jgi:hypothetical protein
MLKNATGGFVSRACLRWYRSEIPKQIPPPRDRKSGRAGRNDNFKKADKQVLFRAKNARKVGGSRRCARLRQAGSSK